jgi:hypothetical protein
MKIKRVAVAVGMVEGVSVGMGVSVGVFDAVGVGPVGVGKGPSSAAEVSARAVRVLFALRCAAVSLDILPKAIRRSRINMNKSMPAATTIR